MKSISCFALIAVLLMILSCSGRRAVTDPTYQPQIINQPDTFAFQATNVANVTQSIQYVWQNSGTSANVNQASQIAAGSATMTIRDAAGQQVYSASLGANGTFVTASGLTGGWTIQLVLTNLTGTLNFRVQRP